MHVWSTTALIAFPAERAFHSLLKLCRCLSLIGYYSRRWASSRVVSFAAVLVDSISCWLTTTQTCPPSSIYRPGVVRGGVVDRSIDQTKLVAMEEKIKVIEEAVEAEKSQGALRDLSQKELEDKMAVCREELEEAKAAKEYAKCSDLQVHTR